MQHTHCFNFSHPFRDSAFDLVLISEVVEHLPKQEYLFLYEL
jgi:2-polyprenyl-3-methyl-5-hydroxy-6-metoxy-1,4-benzoquinol methylase